MISWIELYSWVFSIQLIVITIMFLLDKYNRVVAGLCLIIIASVTMASGILCVVDILKYIINGIPSIKIYFTLPSLWFGYSIWGYFWNDIDKPRKINTRFILTISISFILSCACTYGGIKYVNEILSSVPADISKLSTFEKCKLANELVLFSAKKNTNEYNKVRNQLIQSDGGIEL